MKRVCRPSWRPGTVLPGRRVPEHILRPPYARSGQPAPQDQFITLHDENTIPLMRAAGQLASAALDKACSLAAPGVTADEIDAQVHDAIVAWGAYPAPLNYRGFPKSICASVNDVICHGIPDTTPLQAGDVVSFDVSVYLNGVFGDNCATVCVGDDDTIDEGARVLVRAAEEALDAAVAVCGPGACLTEVGAACHAVADRYECSTVRKYCGHGIGDQFHMLPLVQHFRNRDRLELTPGMIFTIEPMLTEGSHSSRTWSDGWTVLTTDGGRAAQFEHMVHITEHGADVLTAARSS